MNSFITWIGGKKLLRNQIIELFPSNINRYVEVFGGAGWVLFHKDPKSSKSEFFNDINSELINLYKQIKHHPDALKSELEYTIQSRELFFDFRDCSVKGLTEIQRAARYFYLIRASFGGSRTSFGTGKKPLEKNIKYFDEVHQRLKDVVIENKSYDGMIKTYDKVDTFFYLDPPYHETEGYYGTGFNDDDHRKLCEMLKNIKGKFVLSYNDDEFVRELYKDFEVIPVSRHSNLTSNGDKFKELIIKNF